MKSEIPNAPQGFSVSFGDMAHFNWLEVRNADVDYYEIRLDLNAGQNDGLIGRSNNITFSTLLTGRTAKVYCIAHNPAKGYGAPAELTYNIPTPKQPTKVKATANISGIGVTFEPIPVNCKGANVYIDDNVYYITTNALTIPLEAGVYAVKVAYVDMFGEGGKSNDQLVTVKATIPKEMLDRETLGLNDIDRRIAALDKNGSGTLDYAKAVQAMSHSKQLMVDPVFKNMLEIAPYTKDGQQVTIKKQRPYPEYNDPTTGGQCLFVAPGDAKYTSIGFGGFKILPNNKPIEGQLNGTYIVRMLAKAKSDMTLHLNNNHLGKGNTPTGFLTSNKGTDKPEEYVFYWKYGNEWDTKNTDGHDCGYVYFKNNSNTFNNPNFIAVIYKIEVYAVDEYDSSIDDVRSSITQLNSSITTKVENATTGLKSKITQLEGAIDSKISNATNKMGTRITQLDNAIKSQVITGDKVMSAITQYSGGTHIDGKLLHITGDALFDKNIITKGMIQAGAVTADKMQVDSLSSITATIGTLRTKTSGARVEISDDLIQVFDENNQLRVRIGIWE